MESTAAGIVLELDHLDVPGRVLGAARLDREGEVKFVIVGERCDLTGVQADGQAYVAISVFMDDETLGIASGDIRH